MMMICTVGDGMVILNFDEGPLIIYNLYIYIYIYIYIIIWVIQNPKAVRGNFPSPSAFH